jgi:hypothetical protein
MPFNVNEFYKLIEDEWTQGDVILGIDYFGKKVDLAVLITPQCDIRFDKADFLLFVLGSDFIYSFQKVVDPNNELTQDHIKGLIELSKTKLREILSNIIRHLHGATSYRFYYLPAYISSDFNIGHTYLDFQRILTVPREKLSEWKDKRVVTIADPFRSQILARYISYVGRVGTPDYEEEDVYNLLKFSGLSFRAEDFREIYKKLSK